MRRRAPCTLKSSPPVIRQALMKVNWAKRSTSLRVCWASSRVGRRISARQGARLVLGQQAVQQRQQEGRGLAAAGLRRDPQVVPLQRLGNGRGLDRRRLAEGQAFQCLQQAFVEGKLAEQGKPRHCT
ncbi:hypothetical protein HMPREF3150_03385 [Pseudomonas aeruginosa]|nr:hypothetical protein HMPREF3150_03385 [Pseudomonas aeruginosa]